MVELRIRWTLQGVVIERFVDGVPVARVTTDEIDKAIGSVKIELEMARRMELFPGMTDDEIEVELLARGIKAGLHSKGYA
jgi:hypothetical protein